jgi:hypothetical protein
MATVATVVSGATCTVAAEYKDVSGLSASVAAVSATAVTDTTGPSFTAKLTKTVTSAAYTGTLGTSGTYKVTALATGEYHGPAGLPWTVQLIAGTSTTAPTVSVYDVVAKTIVVTACLSNVTTCAAGYGATAQTIVNAINAHTSIATNFVATVVAAGASTHVHGATALSSGGGVVYDLVLTTNEIMMDVATATGFDDGEFTADSNGATAGTSGCTISQDSADTTATPNASDHYLKSMHITCTAATTATMITTGTSQIISSTNTKDWRGNAIPTAGLRVTITAG